MSSSTTCTDVPSSATSEQLCYIHCNFCNIVLAVSVPCSSLFDTVTVRCGNCTNIWSLNVGMTAAFHQSFTGSTSTFQDSSSYDHQHGVNDNIVLNNMADLGFSLPCSNTRPQPPTVTTAQDINNRPLEKKQRIPSLYNRFIKEEIQRIKASNPHISHKEAFSTAAKNWAHFPQVEFGLRLENKHHHANLDENQGLHNTPADKDLED
ncbi:hypothetical protein R6Q59_016315 [Mikania micrantha]